MGLDKKVIFYGNSNNVNVWIKQAKALVLSSRSEGLPTVLIEGQISNTLVVSSDCPDGPAEILKDGKCGILYKVGDFESLAAILDDINRDDFDKDKYIYEASKELYRFSDKEFINKFKQL